MALNLLMLVAGGGASASGFSKFDLYGDEIEVQGHRDNLANPVPKAFVSRLEQSIASAIKTDTAWSQRVWNQSVLVSSGRARLLYEDLENDTDEQFRLVMELVVYKPREDRSVFTLKPPFVIVDCSTSSAKPLPLSAWSENQYSLVKSQLAGFLDQCEKKVLAELPQMLKE